MYVRNTNIGKIVTLIAYVVFFISGYMFGDIFQNYIISNLPALLKNFFVLIILTLIILIYVGEFEVKYFWKMYVMPNFGATRLPPITSSIMIGLWIHASGFYGVA